MTDTLARVFTVHYDENNNPTSITQTRGSSQYTWVTFGYTEIEFIPSFRDLDIVTELKSWTLPVLSQVGLPDGSYYTFDYKRMTVLRIALSTRTVCPDARQQRGGIAMSYLDELFSVAGKTALVTGAATGIGRMAATALVKAGASVMIASRKGDDCVKVAERIERAWRSRAGPKALPAMSPARPALPRSSPRSRRGPTSSTSWSTMPASPGARRWRAFPIRPGPRCWRQCHRRLPPDARVAAAARSRRAATPIRPGSSISVR